MIAWKCIVSTYAQDIKFGTHYFLLLTVIVGLVHTLLQVIMQRGT